MIPPETSAFEAGLYAVKKAFPNTAKKLGVWRPFIALAIGYLGWDNHQSYHRHERRFQQTEEVVSNLESFVTSPPTNGRRVFEVPEASLPSTNRFRRK